MERTITAALETDGSAAGVDVSGFTAGHDLAWTEPGPEKVPSPLARGMQRLLAEYVQETEWVVGWSSCLLPPPPDRAP